MGRVAVSNIANLPGVTELVVADIDETAARGAAQSIVTSQLASCACRVDVGEPGELTAVIERADLVVNTVGPFYRFGVPVLEATIAAGRHYIDICDDWEPTIEMTALHAAAASAGSACVVGMGASPGASNLLAVLACAELDHVDVLYTAWPVDVGDDDAELELPASPDGRPGAATVHWMQQISGTIRVFEGGEFVDRRPLEAVTIDAPGHGAGTVYTVGHPEPITLAVNLNVRDRCANAMVITPGTVSYLDVLRRRIDRGELTNEQAAIAVERPTPAALARAGLGTIGRRGPGKLPLFFAYAAGTRGGERHHATATAWLPGTMADATSIPLAIAVGEMVGGHLPRPGVWASEQVIDPQRFFDTLATYGPEGSTGAAVSAGPMSR
jgi:lysine 6-dehydrogenase